MSNTEFINLSEIYLPTAGGSIDGDVEVGGALQVNDGSGAGTNYDVAAEIAELKSAWDSVSRIFGTSYKLTTTIDAGSNYSSVNGSAYLVGNKLRLYFSATRTSAISGNIKNEIVCTYTINHGGKIAGAFNVGFTGAGTGGNAQYSTDVTVGSETITIPITLGAVAQDTSSFNAFAVVPIVLNFEAF